MTEFNRRSGDYVTVIKDIDGSPMMRLPAEGGLNSVITRAAVVNDNSTLNTLEDLTGLSFSAIAAKTYYFKAVIPYTSAATTTGARFTVDGPTSPTLLYYRTAWTLTATTETFSYEVAYDKPDAAGAASLAAGNIAVVEGYITPSVSGTVQIQFASEIADSAITALAGSILFWQKVS